LAWRQLPVVAIIGSRTLLHLIAPSESPLHFLSMDAQCRHLYPAEGVPRALTGNADDSAETHDFAEPPLKPVPTRAAMGYQLVLISAEVVQVLKDQGCYGQSRIDRKQ
jgi:hypothetical protein